MSKEFIPYETLKEINESILPKEERQKLLEKYKDVLIKFDEPKSSVALECLNKLIDITFLDHNSPAHINLILDLAKPIKQALIQAEKQLERPAMDNKVLEAFDRLTNALSFYEDFISDLPFCVDVEVDWNDVSIVREALEQLKEDK